MTTHTPFVFLSTHLSPFPLRFSDSSFALTHENKQQKPKHTQQNDKKKKKTGSQLLSFSSLSTFISHALSPLQSRSPLVSPASLNSPKPKKQSRITKKKKKKKKAKKNVTFLSFLLVSSPLFSVVTTPKRKEKKKPVSSP